MMEGVIVGLIILALIILIGAISGLVALARSNNLLGEFSRFRRRFLKLETRLERLESKLGMEKPPKEPETFQAIAQEAVEKPISQAQAPSAPPPLMVKRMAATPQPQWEAPASTSPAPAPNEEASAKEAFEAVVGKRWMTWLGVAILFFSAAFFLKYAFDHDLIGPTTQVIISALAGVVVGVLGIFFIGRKMTSLGYGLLGLGMAILYITFAAAASNLYDPPVLEKTTAFILMAIVTAVGMTLAICYNALPIAIIAALGGLLTPILVSTGVNARDALFTYLLILNLGALGAAAFRGWRILDTIIIIGTYLLYYGWFHKYYDPSQLQPALLWLGGFFLMYVIMPFSYHLVQQVEVVIERFCIELVNVIFAFAFAWYLLYRDYQPTLGNIALGLAAIYLLLGLLFRFRLPQDSKALFGTIALAIAFVTIAVPLHLEANGILLAWAIEGPVLLFLGYLFKYRPTRFFAAVVMLLTFFRLIFFHWPEHNQSYLPFQNDEFLTAMLIPVIMGGFALLHHFCRKQATMLDRIIKIIFACGGGLLALCLLHQDLYLWVRTYVSQLYTNSDSALAAERMPHKYDYFIANCSVTGLWLLGSLGYLLAGRWARLTASWLVGVIPLIFALTFCSQVLDYKLPGSQTLFFNLSFATGLAYAVVLFIHAIVIHKTAMPDNNNRNVLLRLFYGAGILFLLALFSLEVPPYVAQEWRSADSAMVEQMSMTVIWGLYAVILLAIGFRRNLAALRYSGLALLGIAALKLLFVDMTKVKDILRVISFVVVGALMIGTSYLYHKFGKKLLAGAGKAEEPDND